jgi:CHASE2 domain-containing sensor protein
VRIFAATFLFGFTAFLRGDEFADKFAIVMVDDQSEAKLGPFPYDRALYAKAAEVCANDGAKAVVFKFFFD